MYLKRIVFLFTFLCLVFAFSISAYAKPDEGTSDGFFDTFVIGQDDLQNNATEGNVGLYVVSEDGISTLQTEDSNGDLLSEDDSNVTQTEDNINNTEGIDNTTQTENNVDITESEDGVLQTEDSVNADDNSNTEDSSDTIQAEDNATNSQADINDYGVFKLNKGFSKMSVVTFANTKMFSGNGDINTTVGIMAFTISEEGEIIPLDESIDNIGLSGIYNASINLQIGDNNVIIVVKKEDLLIYRLFKVTVKEEETKGLLENIQLDFIPGQSDDDSNDVANPLPISNLPGFDAVENLE